MSEPTLVQCGTSYGPAVITAGAILVSAGLAAIGVYYTIRNQRGVARRRAALDVILKSEEDDFYKGLTNTYIEVRDGPGLISVLKAQTSKERETKREIQTYLNHYELISISILQDVIDEGIYKEWMGASFVQRWNETVEFVAELRRKERASIFKNFEDLAVKWGGRPCDVPALDLLSDTS